MEALMWILVLIISVINRFLPLILYVGFTILVGIFAFGKSRLIARYAFILVMLLVPLALVANSYQSFQEACKTAKAEDFSSSPIQNIEGYFSRRSFSPAENYIGMLSYNLLTGGTYEYIEYGNKTSGYAQNRMNGAHVKTSKIIARQSEYDFEITKPEEVSKYFSPYFLTSSVRIVRASDGEIISQATEFLYGGGMLGGMKGTYQGCGYVDIGIHPFRPLIGYSQLADIYKARDREFILKTLVPKSNISRNATS